MATLRVENTVNDYDSWKAVFDKFERFRKERRMRSYRLCRSVDDANRVTMDMVFDSIEDATTFRSALEQIWTTPQSRQQLVSHGTPLILELVEDRAL